MMSKLSIFSLCFALIFAGLAAAQAVDVKPLVMPGKTSWPTAQIVAGIPPYTAGKVTNYGDGGETNWFLIYCAESLQKNVDAYIERFRAAGWTMGKDGQLTTAEKDARIVTFKFYPNQKLLGIEIKLLSTAKDWPSAQFPMLPPLTACESSDFMKNDYDWTVGVYKVSDADMQAYYRLLLAKGWKGGDGVFSWEKSGPKLTLMIDDQGAGTWYFSISE